MDPRFLRHEHSDAEISSLYGREQSGVAVAFGQEPSHQLGVRTQKNLQQSLSEQGGVAHHVQSQQFLAESIREEPMMTFFVNDIGSVDYRRGHLLNRSRPSNDDMPCIREHVLEKGELGILMNFKLNRFRKLYVLEVC